MGHRGSSPEEPGGHFSHAEHADEWMEGMQDRATLQAMMGFFGPEAQRAALGFRVKPPLPEEKKEELREEARQLYAVNKAAKTGERLECPCCRRNFTKNSWQQAFCQRRKTLKGSSCKDTYWNVTDDTRRARSQQYL